eukprot:Rhum_TRINITY_DN14889_c3_g1::Rhum_TRINITY_DN14889_c3_g1_i1::g.126383::m.126383
MHVCQRRKRHPLLLRFRHDSRGSRRRRCRLHLPGAVHLLRRRPPAGGAARVVCAGTRGRRRSLALLLPVHREVVGTSGTRLPALAHRVGAVLLHRRRTLACEGRLRRRCHRCGGGGSGGRRVRHLLRSVLLLRHGGHRRTNGVGRQHTGPLPHRPHHHFRLSCGIRRRRVAVAVAVAVVVPVHGTVVVVGMVDAPALFRCPSCARLDAGRCCCRSRRRLRRRHGDGCGGCRCLLGVLCRVCRSRSDGGGGSLRLVGRRGGRCCRGGYPGCDDSVRRGPCGGGQRRGRHRVPRLERRRQQRRTGRRRRRCPRLPQGTEVVSLQRAAQRRRRRQLGCAAAGGRCRRGDAELQAAAGAAAAHVRVVQESGDGAVGGAAVGTAGLCCEGVRRRRAGGACGVPPVGAHGRAAKGEALAAVVDAEGQAPHRRVTGRRRRVGGAALHRRRRGAVQRHGAALGGQLLRRGGRGDDVASEASGVDAADLRRTLVSVRALRAVVADMLQAKARVSRKEDFVRHSGCDEEGVYLLRSTRSSMKYRYCS